MSKPELAWGSFSQPAPDATGWDAHMLCNGCPHPANRVHSHQMYRSLRRETERPSVSPWNSRTWKARHPGWCAARRALRWLEVTFGA